MTEANGADDAAAQVDATKGDVGDVEAAGETTAAEMIGGAPDTRPVGVDTLANIKVSDTPNPAGNDED
ncbi:MAG TPA: hypothetical protein VGO96_10205 [Pyrinomonadaceae bacterium]|jgi:hypothetical protein|nr:hypothetical protein [Pyrinomonadaceae bacterium]